MGMSSMWRPGDESARVAVAAVAVALGAVALLAVDPAWAQSAGGGSLKPVEGVFDFLVKFLQGPFARSAAIIAVRARVHGHRRPDHVDALPGRCSGDLADLRRVDPRRRAEERRRNLTDGRRGHRGRTAQRRLTRPVMKWGVRY